MPTATTYLSSSSSSSSGFSKVLPVIISAPCVSPKEIVCYAMLDEQSNQTLVDPSLVSFFDITSDDINYSMATANGNTVISGQLIQGLHVRPASSPHSSSLPLPPAWTNQWLPDAAHESATTDDVKNHAHLVPFNFPLKQYDVKTLLLVGRDGGNLLLLLVMELAHLLLIILPWVCLLYTSPSPRDRG